VRPIVLVLGALLAAAVPAAPAVADDGEALDAPAISSPPATASTAPELTWGVVSRRPHDSAAWTQGLQLDGLGRLFESTGLHGRSTLREVDPSSGVVLRSVALPDDHFGEGLALVDDRLIQLTWQEGVANVWDLESFELLDTHAYEGEGWGLCFDGERLVMSDGSSTLTFRDPGSFEIAGHVEVNLDGAPAGRLNELECVGGAVWANLYQTARIARIDPVAGVVDGVLDLEPLWIEQPADASVLNGIAYDASADTFLVTGKLWPELFELRVG
jgi:glutaminyl-peptide cyclotransferase